MLAETTVTMARAFDLESNDVVRIDGRWRLLLEAYTSPDDVEKFYNTEGLYPEMAKAYQAISERWEGDYVILRYVVQEKSTPDEVEDAVKVMDALTLMDVQVRVPRHADPA